MSDKPLSDTSPRSGLTALLGAVTGRLTPEFLALVLIIGGLLVLFDRQNSARERVLAPILAACAESVPIEVLKYLPTPPSNH